MSSCPISLPDPSLAVRAYAIHWELPAGYFSKYPPAVTRSATGKACAHTACSIDSLQRPDEAYAVAMDEKTGVDERRAGEKFVRFIDWLNHKLIPVIGPPDLGPYDAVLQKVGDALCPVCGTPMTEHSIDHSAANTVLHCPAPHRPEPVHDQPINELGMPKRVK